MRNISTVLRVPEAVLDVSRRQLRPTVTLGWLCFGSTNEAYELQLTCFSCTGPVQKPTQEHKYACMHACMYGNAGKCRETHTNTC